MVTWPAGGFGDHAIEAKILEIQRVNKIINNTNRIVFVDIILKLPGKQRDLSPIHTLDKPCHPILPQGFGESYHAQRFHTVWARSSHSLFLPRFSFDYVNMHVCEK